MNTRKYLVLAATVVSLLGLTSCDNIVKTAVKAMMEKTMDHNYVASEELGPLTVKNLELGDFTDIRIHGAVKVEVTQDSACSLQAFGNEKCLEAYEISVEEGVLRASRKGDDGKVNENTPRITLRVWAPKLEDIQVHGAGTIEFQDTICMENDLDIDVQGAGEIDIDYLETKNLTMKVSGAGDVEIGHLKATEEVSLNISGAGEISGDVECHEIETILSGAAELELQVKCDVLRTELNGAGSLKLTGECRRFVKNVNRAASLDIEGLTVKEQ